MTSQPDTRVFAHLAHDGEVKAVYIHQRAAQTITDMRTRVADLGRTFGEHSEEYLKASRTLGYCLGSIFLGGFAPEAYVMKDTTVTNDGELSLLVQEGNAFVYGIVFFRDRSYDDLPDDDPRKGLPIPGEWSMHS